MSERGQVWKQRDYVGRIQQQWVEYLSDLNWTTDSINWRDGGHTTQGKKHRRTNNSLYFHPYPSTATAANQVWEKDPEKRLGCKYRCVTHQPRSQSKSYVCKGVRLPGRTFKGIKEHQNLGLNKDELMNKSEEEIHDRQWGQRLRKKEVTHCVKYQTDQQRDSHWWPLSTASEEWQRPPIYNGPDHGQEASKSLL